MPPRAPGGSAGARRGAADARARVRLATPSWLQAGDETWLRSAALAPLLLLEGAYRAGARLHRAAYERGWREPERVPCRVISVGNLCAGGTGKTPFAAWLAAALAARGHRPALLSRGSGRARRDPVTWVSDGRRILADVAAAGDEPLLLAAAAPGVPVLVGRARARLARQALAQLGCDVALLDDGFQHHRLARDLDLVLIDAAQGLGNGHLLPRGPLREPVAALARADAIGLVDGEPGALLAQLLERRAPQAFRFQLARRTAGLRRLADAAPLAAAELAGEEVGLLAAIARPDSLRRRVEALGARVVATRFFSDHHRYRASDLRGLARGARRWITTDKDAVKLSPRWARPAELVALSLAIEVEAPAALLDFLEARLR